MVNKLAFLWKFQVLRLSESINIQRRKTCQFTELDTLFTSIWITTQKQFTLLTASNFHISLRHNFRLQTTFPFGFSFCFKDFFIFQRKKKDNREKNAMKRRQKMVKKKTWLSVYANGKKKFILHFIFSCRNFLSDFVLRFSFAGIIQSNSDFTVEKLEGFGAKSSNEKHIFIFSAVGYELHKIHKATEQVWEESFECQRKWGEIIKNDKKSFAFKCILK